MSNGKGDTYRKVDQKKYANNWERIFGNESNRNESGHKVRKGKGRNAGQDQARDVSGPSHGDGDKV